MKKMVFAAVATMVLGGAVVAQPAQARCEQSGAVSVCRGSPRAAVVIVQQGARAGRLRPGVVYQMDYRR